MEIENLKALVYGHDLSAYQKALAQKEFESMQKAALNIGNVIDCTTCKWDGLDGNYDKCNRCSGDYDLHQTE